MKFAKFNPVFPFASVSFSAKKQIDKPKDF